VVPEYADKKAKGGDDKLHSKRKSLGLNSVSYRISLPKRRNYD